MTGYQGPISWRDNLKNRVNSSFQTQSIVNQMDDFDPGTDPEFDYLSRAEAVAHRNQQLQSQLSQQLLENTMQRLQNRTTRGLNQLHNPQQPQGGGSKFDAFRRAILQQESGGNYRAVNPDSGALGGYQVMPSNILGPGGWDVETIGRDVNRSAYLNHPRLQNRIAGQKLHNYFNQYGAAGAASAWYSGDPSLWNNRNPQGNYPSIHSYVLDILRMMRR